jgi:hypothetical protein
VEQPDACDLRIVNGMEAKLVQMQSLDHGHDFSPRCGTTNERCADDTLGRFLSHVVAGRIYRVKTGGPRFMLCSVDGVIPLLLPPVKFLRWRLSG